MEMTKLPDTVETVEAFQTCMHAKGVTFRAHLEATGPAAVEALLSAAQRRGAIFDLPKWHTMSTPEKVAVFPFAVLSLIDSNGTILDDSTLIPASSWEWWTAAAGLKPTHPGCPICGIPGSQAANPYHTA